MTSFRCEDCGKTFKSNAALGSHKSRMHADAELQAEVEAELKALVQPLLTRLETIDADLQEAKQQVRKLTASRNFLRSSLRRIAPNALPADSSKPGPKQDQHALARTAVTKNPEKVARVVDFIEQHEWPNGFTRTDVYRTMKEQRGEDEDVVGPNAIAGVIEQMHSSGMVRVDRHVKGGANVYKLIGNPNGA